MVCCSVTTPSPKPLGEYCRREPLKRLELKSSQVNSLSMRRGPHSHFGWTRGGALLPAQSPAAVPGRRSCVRPVHEAVAMARRRGAERFFGIPACLRCTRGGRQFSSYSSVEFLVSDLGTVLLYKIPTEFLIKLRQSLHCGHRPRRSNSTPVRRGDPRKRSRTRQNTTGQLLLERKDFEAAEWPLGLEGFIRRYLGLPEAETVRRPVRRNAQSAKQCNCLNLQKQVSREVASMVVLQSPV